MCVHLHSLGYGLPADLHLPRLGVHHQLLSIRKSNLVMVMVIMVLLMVMVAIVLIVKVMVIVMSQ
jgi:hypothetical protein